MLLLFMPGGRGRQGDLLRNFLFNSERVPAIRGLPEHTSVGVPLLVRSHQHHAKVVRWWDGQELALSGQALAETYSVLTRRRGLWRTGRPGGERRPGPRRVPRGRSGRDSRRLRSADNRTGWPVASAAKWSSSTASAHWADVRWGVVMS